VSSVEPLGVVEPSSTCSSSLFFDPHSETMLI
jgi:hypothetical protein